MVGGGGRSLQVLTIINTSLFFLVIIIQILEKALKIVFTTQNISQVKQYVQKQFQKIVDGRINLQELVFAKEYRGRQYYKPGACVPALELTK